MRVPGGGSRQGQHAFEVGARGTGRRRTARNPHRDRRRVAKHEDRLGRGCGGSGGKGDSGGDEQPHGGSSTGGRRRGSHESAGQARSRNIAANREAVCLAQRAVGRSTSRTSAAKARSGETRGRGVGGVGGEAMGGGEASATAAGSASGGETQAGGRGG